MTRLDKQDRNQTRLLTVGRVADGKFHPTRSSLKLAGDWLTKLGFAIGDIVEIAERDGSLVVRKLTVIP